METTQTIEKIACQFEDIDTLENAAEYFTELSEIEKAEAEANRQPIINL